MVEGSLNISTAGADHSIAHRLPSTSKSTSVKSISVSADLTRIYVVHRLYRLTLPPFSNWTAVRDPDNSREVRPFIGEIRLRWCWPSPAYEAAVDDQIDARAEGRRLTGQKDSRPDQLVNVGHAAYGGVGLELLCLPRHLRAQIHRGGRVARTDGVDAYTSINPFHCQAFGQVDDRGF